MAKTKSRIKEVVETVESWVGMGPKAKKKAATSGPKKASKKGAKKSRAKTAKKGKKKAKKKR
jgi:hypothetical protein